MEVTTNKLSQLRPAELNRVLGQVDFDDPRLSEPGAFGAVVQSLMTLGATQEQVMAAAGMRNVKLQS